MENPISEFVIWSTRLLITLVSERCLKYKLQLTFPIARSPLSNRSNTPRKRNDTPNPARPTPISVTEHLELFL
jgi:hypothetical protein